MNAEELIKEVYTRIINCKKTCDEFIDIATVNQVSTEYYEGAEFAVSSIIDFIEANYDSTLN